jgi:hypothetical protein
MIVFRQADPRYPFLWTEPSQPEGRWHAAGEGPVHYFSDTPDGAWAELLRHEEITDPEDAATIRRALWAVEIGDEPAQEVALPASVTLGRTYAACQDHARRLRAGGVRRIVAPSAALVPGGASGRHVVAGAERQTKPRSGRVIVIFGPPDGLVGWKTVERGGPPADVVPRVRHLDVM